MPRHQLDSEKMNVTSNCENTLATTGDVAAPPRSHTMAPPETVSPYCEAPKTLSLTGMVMGIVGIALGPGGIPFAITALVLGNMGSKNEPGARGFWLTARITGWVGLAFGAIFFALFIVMLVVALNTPSAYQGRYSY